MPCRRVVRQRAGRGRTSPLLGAASRQGCRGSRDRGRRLVRLRHCWSWLSRPLVLSLEALVEILLLPRSLRGLPLHLFGLPLEPKLLRGRREPLDHAFIDTTRAWTPVDVQLPFLGLAVHLEFECDVCAMVTHWRVLTWHPSTARSPRRLWLGRDRIPAWASAILQSEGVA